MKILNSFPVEKWLEVDTIEPRKVNERKIITIAVGFVKDTKEFITEEIFEDIIPQIIDKTYKVDIDIYSTPHLVITDSDRNIVCHNEDIADTLELIEAIMGEYSQELKEKALAELLSNKYHCVKLGDSAKSIRDMVKNSTKKDYNLSFLLQALMIEMRKKYATKYNSLSNKELYLIATKMDSDEVKKEIYKRFICMDIR